MVAAVNEFDVAVAGAGIVGLAAAIQFSRQYERVALIDNSEYIPWQAGDPYGLRVSALNPASIELLNALEVWPRVTQMRAFPYRAMRVWEQASNTAIGFDASDTCHDALGAIVENQVLLTGLHAVLQQTASVRRFKACALADLSAIADTAMLLELDNGDRISARLVIGADGQDSRVRQCIGADCLRRHYQQRAIVACVQTEHDHQQTAWQCFTEDGPLALLALQDNLCALVWSVSEQRSAVLSALADQQFNQQLTQAFESRLGRLSLVSERKSFSLAGMQARRYIDDRVVLLGDAAHVVHPLAGLGLNLGLADLACLSRLLAESDRPLGSARVLRRYERARKTENMLMQRCLEIIDALFRARQPGIKPLRAAGVNLTDKILPLKMLFMRQALGVPP